MVGLGQDCGRLLDHCESLKRYRVSVFRVHGVGAEKLLLENIMHANLWRSRCDGHARQAFARAGRFLCSNTNTNTTTACRILEAVWSQEERRDTSDNYSKTVFVFRAYGSVLWHTCIYT